MDIRGDLHKLNYLGQLPDSLMYNRKPFVYQQEEVQEALKEEEDKTQEESTKANLPSER